VIRVWRIDGVTREEARIALLAILERAVGRPVVLDRLPQGKPYLRELPHIKFNLSDTKGRALVAVSGNIEVGVDIERIRSMSDIARIAERFLPPGDAEVLADTPTPDREREFFRRWTRAEALWKAAGLGLYCAGKTPDGDWHVEDIDAGEGYSAAVAASAPCLPITISSFGADA
jgi:4'-phosphopantetheinyl transferase